MFFAEYANMVTGSRPRSCSWWMNGPPSVHGGFKMALPTVWFLSYLPLHLCLIMVRATVPRIRYDQLMQFG
jgi:NADH:ubiquinone oxidoreductase subunit H